MYKVIERLGCGALAGQDRPAMLAHLVNPAMAGVDHTVKLMLSFCALRFYAVTMRRLTRVDKC